MAADDESGRKPQDEQAYAGVAGRTRVEQRHVVFPGGAARVVPVYVVVDVVANPELREPTFAGALHRFESGERLAVPFVFHDPSATELVLVVPEELRHRALNELAALHQRIADDCDHPVPTYAQRPALVVGVDGLKAHLEGPQSTAKLGAREAELQAQEQERSRSMAALTEREQTLEERERHVSSREARLHERGEDLTTREDDLRDAFERLTAERNGLVLKEQELDDRLAALQEREASVREVSVSQVRPEDVELMSDVDMESDATHEAEPDTGEVMTPEASELIESAERHLPRGDEFAAEEFAAAFDVEAVELRDADDDVEEVEALEELDELQALEDLDGFEELSPVDEVREVDDVEDLVDADDLEDLHTDVGELSRETAGPVESVIPAPVTPPDEFLQNHDRQMAASLVQDEPWFFVRLSEGHDQAYRDDADLLAQYVLVDGYPLVLLALVTEPKDGGRPYIRRVALDPSVAGDGAILARLANEFSAHVAVFSAHDHFERVVDVSAPRHQNLQHILERARLDRSPEIDAATATERALAAPPPVRLSGHPFVVREPAADATAALDALARLSKWSAPAKLDMALMALSIPREVVDAAFERVLGDALRFGIALDAELASRALSAGLASDMEQLVSAQVSTFAQLTSKGERGLSPNAIAQNWEGLLESARENEVALDADTHDLAQRALSAIGRAVEEPGEHVDPSELPGLTADRLLRLFTHPTLRLAAARELLGRDDADLKALCREARKLPREEVLEVLPGLVARGEAAGDALIDGLTARKTFFRQAAALGLGQIHLRRAVVPLVHLLAEEPSDVWREVPRVISLFGTGAVRALARAAKDPKFPAERATLALAHLSVAGCEKQVEKLEGDSNRALAEAALAARMAKADAERQARVVLGQDEPLGEDATLLFSRSFCASINTQG